MDRGHQPVPDPHRLVQHLRRRREAVGRARGVGDDVMIVGVVDVVEVDAEHDRGVRRVGALGRRGDDHLARTRLEVLGCVGPRAELASGLDHHVDAELLPRQRCRDRSRPAPGRPCRRSRCRRRWPRRRRERARTPSRSLSRWARVSASARSFTATNSMAASCSWAARRTLRPTRPKPLMATRTVMSDSFRRGWGAVAAVRQGAPPRLAGHAITAGPLAIGIGPGHGSERSADDAPGNRFPVELTLARCSGSGVHPSASRPPGKESGASRESDEMVHSLIQRREVLAHLALGAVLDLAQPADAPS